MALALFDLDRTLLSVNAGQLWVTWEWRAGRLSRWQATRAAAWIFGYHLGYTRMEKILTEGVGTLRGQSEAELRARTRTFYEEVVASTYRPRAAAIVAEHIGRGDTVALLTTSSLYLSEPVMTTLGIPHTLCNRFEVEDGRFTGRPIEPLCFGEGKLEHARRFAEAHGESLEDATFYTDSASDLSVLAVVGTPVAVHPDPRLRRTARRRGWRIDSWD